MHPHNDAHHDTESEAVWGRQGFRPFLGMAQQFQGLMGQPAQRARRGDVRTAILRLLAEEQMHGYQIIGELAERSAGTWSPSAGSVYPTLQLLADEGLVVAEAAGGKKVYRLTEAGVDAAAQLAGRRAPWDEAADTPSGRTGYHQAAGRLIQAVFQVGRTGSPQQVSSAVDVLNDARKHLYAVLAED
ncbi:MULTISPECIES: PadR family transcriptional regulator [unclassified Ornithinimicrobium]|uniref:PadR family transcriptional regulator n=1 Tax=unclassified Ornithinimicrobium TaxID=2615080 RepID=UPI003852AFD5